MRALSAEEAVGQTYQDKGPGNGWAHFMAKSMWQGEFTDAYAAQPAPDPASFGSPADDDGSRDDPMLSGASDAVTRYAPDIARPQVGIDSDRHRSRDPFRRHDHRAHVGRCRGGAGPAADGLPEQHGGFLGGEYGQTGEPEAFAAKLHDVLDTP